MRRSTPSRLKKVAFSPNTQRQTQRVKQNKATENYVPNERTRQNLSKDLNDMEVK